jgi:hypothetical protein
MIRLMNVVIKLSGGLGNQLFQYATGRALAVAHSRDLVIDLHWYHAMPAGSTPRRELLSQLRIVASFADSAGNPAAFAPAPRGLWQKLFQPAWPVRERKTFRRDPRLCPPPSGHTSWVLDGYWQCPTYFQAIRPLLLSEIAPRRAPDPHYADIAARIEASESVSLHVRRGDYVHSASASAAHGTLPLAYYARAMAHVRARCREPVVFVFSDDPQWARENIATGVKTVYVESAPGDEAVIDELMLMRRCKHQIIANSSLSWWGAWLNENPHRIVTAPQRWLAERPLDLRDLIPPDWTVLPVE